MKPNNGPLPDETREKFDKLFKWKSMLFFLFRKYMSNTTQIALSYSLAHYDTPEIEKKIPFS